MIPVPIENDDIWEGSTRCVVSPPDGDMLNNDIRAVEALVDHPESMGGTPRFCMKFVLEDGELEILQNGGNVWLGMWGIVVPFVVDVR